MKGLLNKQSHNKLYLSEIFQMALLIFQSCLCDALLFTDEMLELRNIYFSTVPIITNVQIIERHKRSDNLR